MGGLTGNCIKCTSFGVEIWKMRIRMGLISLQWVCLCVRAFRRVDSLGQLLFGVSAQLQQSHEHCRHVHVRLPHGEASANQIDGGAADGAVGGQLGAGGLQQQEGQRLTCRRQERAGSEESGAEPGAGGGGWRDKEERRDGRCIAPLFDRLCLNYGHGVLQGEKRLGTLLLLPI